MRICFVHSGELTAYTGREEALTVFGFNGIGEVRYEKELKGESNFFEGAAKLSKRLQNVVVSGCITDTRGHRRKSALVAENGRLLGVSDMLHTFSSEYSSGAELRIYPTSIGRIGVLVAEDLYFPETVKALTDCAADFIVCPFGQVAGELPSVLLRAYAFAYGAPVFFCGEGYSAVASPKGELVFSATKSPAYAEYCWQKEYCLVERRLRGKSCP